MVAPLVNAAERDHTHKQETKELYQGTISKMR